MAAVVKALDAALVLKAATALLAHIKKEATDTSRGGGVRNLLDDPDAGPSTAVYLQIALAKLPGRASNKPLRMCVRRVECVPRGGGRTCARPRRR